MKKRNLAHEQLADLQKQYQIEKELIEEGRRIAVECGGSIFADLGSDVLKQFAISFRTKRIVTGPNFLATNNRRRRTTRNV